MQAGAVQRVLQAQRGGGDGASGEHEASEVKRAVCRIKT